MVPERQLRHKGEHPPAGGLKGGEERKSQIRMATMLTGKVSSEGGTVSGAHECTAKPPA